MEHQFTILQPSFFGCKPSVESLPCTLLSNGDIVDSVLKTDEIGDSRYSLSSTGDSYVSYVGSLRSVDSNISQSSLGSRGPPR